MNRAKNFLIALGILIVAVFLLVLVLGVKIAGTVLFWVLGGVVLLWIVIWVAYMVGKSRSRPE